eukprot:5631504-Pyramimonas_sp.AAC.3
MASDKEEIALLEALTALRKGAPLKKYCRGGKPHLCYFRLSADERELTWESRSQKAKAVSFAMVRP